MQHHNRKKNTLKHRREEKSSRELGVVTFFIQSPIVPVLLFD